VLEIRALYATGEFRQEDLAVEYGVSRPAISLVVANKHYHDPNYDPPAAVKSRRRISHAI